MVRNISARDLILPLDKGGRLILPVPRAGQVLVPVVREGLGFAEGIDPAREPIRDVVLVGGGASLRVGHGQKVPVRVIGEAGWAAEGINGRREVVQRIVETNWMVGPGGGVAGRFGCGDDLASVFTETR